MSAEDILRGVTAVEPRGGMNQFMYPHLRNPRFYSSSAVRPSTPCDLTPPPLAVREGNLTC